METLLRAIKICKVFIIRMRLNLGHKWFVGLKQKEKRWLLQHGVATLVVIFWKT
jgi:hypothetical protein